ncbi:MAG: hypothetical protein M3Z24_09555, partial [Chloroflexota bacterium]|nr:hypothetical protein [Chloroflexota bacterium]
MKSRQPLGDMSPEQLRQWIWKTHAWVKAKMQRERVYLDRRAAQGRHTSIDEEYEADQLREADLLSFLEEMEQRIQ